MGERFELVDDGRVGRRGGFFGNEHFLWDGGVSRKNGGLAMMGN